jgi:rubredoxin
MTLLYVCGLCHQEYDAEHAREHSKVCLAKEVEKLVAISLGRKGVK